MRIGVGIAFVIMLVGLFGACSAPEGPSALRASIDVAGDARQDFAGEDALGADVANESNVDERVGEAPEALTGINCKSRGLDVVECMIQCAKARIPCTPSLRHPKKADGGDGNLMGCGEALSRKTCVYEYTNGDRCYVFDSLPDILCSYPGG